MQSDSASGVDSSEVRRARRAVSALREQIQSLDDDALDLLFRQARSHNGWTAQTVSDELLSAIYDIARMGPTSANCCPARFVFLRTQEAKEKLRPALAKGNVDKSMTAPVVAIVAHDMKFYAHMAMLFPHNPRMQDILGRDAAQARTTAFRNGTLQGAYLMIAARALGLDCGPMSGFDEKSVNEIFFADSSVQANFLCALGYGDPEKLFQRLPRFAFEQACTLL